MQKIKIIFDKKLIYSKIIPHEEEKICQKQVYV